MRGAALGSVAALLTLALTTPARAERGETAVGLTGGLALPAFASQDPTDFALATWTAGAYAEQGLLDDLFVGGRFTFSRFDAVDIDHQTTYRARTYEGDLAFELHVWHVEATARYKLYAGHDLAPHFTAAAGYAWTVYRDPVLTTEAGTVPVDDTTDDFAEGALTIAGGLALDYRLLNTVFLTAELRYVHFTGDGLYRSALQLPVSAAWYW